MELVSIVFQVLSVIHMVRGGSVTKKHTMIKYVGLIHFFMVTNGPRGPVYAFVFAVRQC